MKVQVSVLLTIAKLHGDSVAYYQSTVDESLGLDGYYSEAGTSPASVFVKTGTDKNLADIQTDLGVEDGQRVDGKTVSKWFNRCVAPSGNKLGRALGAKGRPGFDLTFCAPKSVSLLWAFGDDELKNQVDLAHKKAVDQALDYLSRHAGYTRRGVNGAVIEPVLGLSGVRYEHKTSRAGDPHTHTHVLLSNKQLCGDGKFRTLDSKSLYHEARAAGMIYQAALRQILSDEMDVSWGENVNGCAEIFGLDDKRLLESFSTRTKDIDAWIKANGVEDLPQFARMGQKVTRRAKDLTVGLDQLESEWVQDEYAETIKGFIRDNVKEPASITYVRPLTAKEVLAAVVEEKSTFTRADLVEKAAELWPVDASFSKDIFGDIERFVDETLDGQIAWMVNPGQQRAVDLGAREGALRFTTDVVVDEINQGIDLACQVVNRGVDASCIVPVEGKLSENQAEAMKTVVASPFLASVVVAPAGAGKTSSLKAARKAWEQAGKKVVGLAPTGKAADVMVGEEVAHSSSTIAKAFMGTDGLSYAEIAAKLGWDSSTVVVVDEAGMVGSPDMVRVLETVCAAGARVVFVGDPHQYGAVKQRSGMLATLAYELPDCVELVEVFRQKNIQERQASKWLRDGDQADIERAASWYADNGRLHSGSHAAMVEDVLSAWAADIDAGLDALMVASTREDVAELNRLAQKIYCACDGVGTDIAGGKVFAGDIILTRKNSYQIICCDGQPVRNGQRWQVVEVKDDGLLAVSVDNPEVTVVLPFEYVAQHVQLGYATTGHASQGVTVDTCHVLAGVGCVDRAGVYVPLTRGRQENHLYLAERVPGDIDTSPFEFASPTIRRDSVEQARDLLVQAAFKDRKDVSPHEVYRQARLDFELAKLSSGQRFDTDPYRGTRAFQVMEQREKLRQKRCEQYQKMQVDSSVKQPVEDKSRRLLPFSDYELELVLGMEQENSLDDTSGLLPFADFDQEVKKIFVLAKGKTAADDIEGTRDYWTQVYLQQGDVDGVVRSKIDQISKEIAGRPWVNIRSKELEGIVFAREVFDEFVSAMADELQVMQECRGKKQELLGQDASYSDELKTVESVLRSSRKRLEQVKRQREILVADFEQLGWVKQQFRRNAFNQELEEKNDLCGQIEHDIAGYSAAVDEINGDISRVNAQLDELSAVYSEEKEKALQADYAYWFLVQEQLGDESVYRQMVDELVYRYQLGDYGKVDNDFRQPVYHDAPWTRSFVASTQEMDCVVSARDAVLEQVTPLKIELSMADWLFSFNYVDESENEDSYSYESAFGYEEDDGLTL